MHTKHLELEQVGIDFPTPKGPFTALQDVNLKIKIGESIGQSWSKEKHIKICMKRANS